METFSIRALSFAYPDQPDNTLHEISLDIQPGEFLVLCGPSGCGKSTLLRQLKPVMAPHGQRSGEILFEGRPLGQLDQQEQARRIGFVQQSPDNQIVTDKVWHELAFGLESLGYDTPTIRRRVAEMASFFGIEHWFHKDVSQLSGGQKQLLNLASIMVMQPSVLILDEPTSQLDPIAASEFLATIRKINLDLGITVIIIEHRLEEVFPMADKVLVLEDGRVGFYDEPRAVGKALADNDLFLAMPSSVQIYNATGQDGVCPLTVCEGRTWLKDNFEPEGPLIRTAEDKTRHKKEKIRQKSEYIIEAKELWFRYEKDGKDIVKDMSLQVQKGELFCILGGNGTGKSTTMKLLSGIKTPYRGKILLDGRDIRKISDHDLFHHFLGVLPQNPQALFVGNTVREDLEEMFADQITVTKKVREEKMAKVIADCEIGHLLDMHPYDLSGGEQQRAALAKVLLLEPRILLLDEPTKGLDGFYKYKLAGIFQKLKDEGITILMVSHDIEFCASYGDSCAMFFDGGVVTSCAARDFFVGNCFYTTVANRMARYIFPEAVTVKDVIEACRRNKRKA